MALHLRDLWSAGWILRMLNAARASQPVTAEVEHARKPARERCSACGVAFMRVETTFQWERDVVCGKCYQRHQAARILAAVVAPNLLPSTSAAAAGARDGIPANSTRRVLCRPGETGATHLSRGQRSKRAAKTDGAA